ncbi:glycoside hydrolase family 13 protein [Brachybacterium hainanense]|uniref:Glycoside hydrolase family 13 protein n=1 Tax=Brachybacterium hainanense TaxID=1541174 RepID=A0ABV6RDV6_9MICO
MTLTETAETLLVDDANWWRQAAVYQIYPRSFADANGDGVGDLRGIISRVPYLQNLGIDAVWLSPFYPSALADGGYDVDDYRGVDPKIGTLEEFDEMVEALHCAGIRLIVDLVPNHSSDRHIWFQEALRSPKGSPARDRYIFRDGMGENGELPPSDWTSIFGGSTWTQVEDGQWYLHMFATEQPDFNWDNPEVREDFLTTLRFWSDRGVDGFRVDVAHGLAKKLEDVLPSKAEMAEIQKSGEPGAHPLWDRDEVHDIYSEWRRVFDEYTPPRIAVAEAWVARDRRPRYASADGLGQAFNFDLLQADFDAQQFRDIIRDNLDLAAASGSSTTWVFSNHDVVRHATRYGLLGTVEKADGTAIMSTPGKAKAWLLHGAPEDELDRDRGLRRARAATLLELGLPGSAYLYQGEELGLHEVGEIPDEARQDPAFFRNKGVEVGRDGCRVPLPWSSDGPSLGFGPGGTHLPQPSWYAEHSVAAEDRDPGSTLNMYRRALELRRELQAGETLEWVETGDPDILHFRRPNGWEVVTNFGNAEVPLPKERIVLASGPIDSTLPAETTVWIAP